MNLGEFIRKVRKQKGYTQWQLAYILNVDPTYISKIENGKTDYAPSQELLTTFADVMDIDIEDIWRVSGYFDAKKLAEKASQTHELGMLLRQLQECDNLTEIFYNIQVWKQAMNTKPRPVNGIEHSENKE